MRHKYLDGKLMEGNHPPLVSIETFKKVNDIIAETHTIGYEHKRGNENVPLVETLKCPHCGGNVTFYESTKMRNKYGKGGYYYYYCSRKKCKFNVREIKAHQQFEELLSGLELSNSLKEGILFQLTKLVEYATKESRSTQMTLSTQYTQTKNQIDELETKWALENDSKKQGMLLRAMEKKEDELRLIERELKAHSTTISNPEKVVKYAVDTYSNSLNIWKKSELKEKQLLQKCVFPNGIVYDKENETYRTSETNPLFDIINKYSGDCNDSKEKRTDNFHCQSVSVPRTVSEICNFQHSAKLKNRRQLNVKTNIINIL